jgi:hypothetical protein
MVIKQNTKDLFLWCNLQVDFFKKFNSHLKNLMVAYMTGDVFK